MDKTTRLYALLLAIFLIGSFGTGFTRAAWQDDSGYGIGSLWLFLLIEGRVGIAFIRALAAVIREDARKEEKKQAHPSREEA